MFKDKKMNIYQHVTKGYIGIELAEFSSSTSRKNYIAVQHDNEILIEPLTKFKHIGGSKDKYPAARKFEIGDKVKKIIGYARNTGTVVANCTKLNGEERIVYELDGEGWEDTFHIGNPDDFEKKDV